MSDSIQARLLRIRPPRVKITYDVETSGTIEKRELPFVIAILADLSGDRDAARPQPALQQRGMLTIDRDNFDEVMRSISPRIVLADASTISFASLDDFTPERIVRQVPASQPLVQERAEVRAAQARAEMTDGSSDALLSADQRIADIDRELSTQLNAILHAPNFQRLEAAWRGLRYLVQQTETTGMLQLRLLNASRQELQDDLEQAATSDQSHLFQLVSDAESGSSGSTPCSLLLADYAVGPDTQSLSFITRLAQLAARLNAPCIMSAASTLFGLDSFADLMRPRDLSKIFESVELEGWREFRETDDARFLALNVPRVLMRLPYGRDGTPVQGMAYEEAVLGEDKSPLHDAFLWGHSTWMLAERIANAFSLYSWPVAIQGKEGGGFVEGLPAYVSQTAAGPSSSLGPAEVVISDARQAELADLGFVALGTCNNAGGMAFFTAVSTSLPKRYLNPITAADAVHAAQLPYLLAACRFAHYVQVIMRKKIGSFLTRGNVETYINGWIAPYVLLDDTAAAEVQASYPLNQAKVTVTEVAGEPGAYDAEIFLRPRFQLEELGESMRVVVRLPA